MPDIKDTSGPGLFARMKVRYAENASKQDMQKARRIGLIGIPIGLILVGGYRTLNRPDPNAISFTVGVMQPAKAPPHGAC